MGQDGLCWSGLEWYGIGEEALMDFNDCRMACTSTHGMVVGLKRYNLLNELCFHYCYAELTSYQTMT